jgi:hypothetical protein
MGWPVGESVLQVTPPDRLRQRSMRHRAAFGGRRVEVRLAGAVVLPAAALPGAA